MGECVRRAVWMAAALGLASIATSCATTKLNVAWDLGPRAVSNSQFSGARHTFRRIMIVPPSGNVRGAFDHELSVFERKFLKVGVTLISPAITGRVVGSDNDQGRPTDVAGGLSDVERALILARKSGVEAILQVGSFGPDGFADRLLCGSSPDAVRTCDPQAWLAAPWKVTLHGRVLRFQGRLLDVENGEIIGSLDVSQAIWNNSSYTWTYHEGGQPLVPHPAAAQPQSVQDCENPGSDYLKSGCAMIDGMSREEIIDVVVTLVGGK